MINSKALCCLNHWEIISKSELITCYLFPESVKKLCKIKSAELQNLMASVGIHLRYCMDIGSMQEP